MKRTSRNDNKALPKYGLIVDGQVYEWLGNDFPEQTEEQRSTHDACVECDLRKYCSKSPYRFLPCLSLYDEGTFDRVIRDRKLKFSNFKKYEL